MTKKCEYCYHEGRRDCLDWHLREGTQNPWRCTRERGHDGPHIACGGRNNHEMFMYEIDRAPDKRSDDDG